MEDVTCLVHFCVHFFPYCNTLKRHAARGLSAVGGIFFKDSLEAFSLSLCIERIKCEPLKRSQRHLLAREFMFHRLISEGIICEWTRSWAAGKKLSKLLPCLCICSISKKHHHSNTVKTQYTWSSWAGSCYLSISKIIIIMKWYLMIWWIKKIITTNTNSFSLTSFGS